ncbi:YlaF family protein [Bacillus sp. B-jedd]|uniref:YlaF family protein n=1 Tax=Bacillus sp. B-jedd TaxID=1476857 RepID=UPI000515724B|nr:YlaF family protein [Bacillus sp. B-jedd]CEG26677.1 hypothetical protein BN1002_01527 [Bacillus sp. B-jedd]
MKNIKWNALGYAVLAAASLSGVGVAIGEKSFLILALSIAFLILAMHGGFKSKKRPSTK